MQANARKAPPIRLFARPSPNNCKTPWKRHSPMRRRVLSASSDSRAKARSPTTKAKSRSCTRTAQRREWWLRFIQRRRHWPPRDKRSKARLRAHRPREERARLFLLSMKRRSQITKLCPWKLKRTGRASQGRRERKSSLFIWERNCEAPRGQRGRYQGSVEKYRSKARVQRWEGCLWRQGLRFQEEARKKCGYRVDGLKKE